MNQRPNLFCNTLINNGLRCLFVGLVILCVMRLTRGEDGEVTDNSEVGFTTYVPSVNDSSTIPPGNNSCEVHDNDCSSCVANKQCYYCDSNRKCDWYIEHLVPTTCGLKNAHYLTCKVSFQYVMIAVGVMIGLALLIIIITCCCCCCKKKGIKLSNDDLKWVRQREERKQIAAEKRKERAERTEEIRRKYGLVKDTNPYERFDA